MPKYWRPPYGDSDNRVRAIAKEVSCFWCTPMSLSEMERYSVWTLSFGIKSKRAVKGWLKLAFTSPLF